MVGSDIKRRGNSDSKPPEGETIRDQTSAIAAARAAQAAFRPAPFA